MYCPRCKKDSARRSRRRSLLDYALGLFGIRAWRCRECEHRFHGRSVPLRLILYAHCPHCGNFEVQRVARIYVDGWNAWLLRLLHVPALRCDPCRYKFFSIRPLRRLP